jgi:Flp pilus assembly protein TadD
MGSSTAGAKPAATATRRPKQDFETLLRTANASMQAGQLESAAMQYEQVLKVRPKTAMALASLGRVKGMQGHREEGIVLLRKALTLNSSDPTYYLALAYLLYEDGQVEESTRMAERAAKLGPDLVIAQQSLALWYERTNQLDRAKPQAEKALSLDPGHGPTKVVLASILRREKKLGEARELLQEVVNEDGFDNLTSRASHQLGLVLDKLGEYDEAFAAFVQTGTAQLQTPQGRRVDKEVQTNRIADYRRELTPELLSRWTRADFDDDAPVPRFLVGFPRSGTTMTEQVMAAHPGMRTLDERGMVQQVLDEMMLRHRDTNIPRLLDRLELDELRQMRADYWTRVRAELKENIEGRVVLDKHPMLITEAGAINVIFPEAKLLVALRDPRDVCLSCFIQDFNINEAMIHFATIEGTTKFYARVMDLWLHLREMITLDYLEFKYEDTVDDLEGQSRRLLEFLDLEWSERILRFHEIAPDRAIATPSYEAVTQRVHKGAMGRWHNYEKHVAEAMKDVEPFVKAFGYDE